MAYSYFIVVLLTLAALVPGVKERNRLTLIEALVLLLLLVAPLSLMRDVPQYITIFESLLGGDGFPEMIVRLMLAASFIGGLEVMFRTGFSMGSITTYVFLALPTVACNQLRLSFAIFVYLLLQGRWNDVRSVFAGSLIHQSLVLGLFMPQRTEGRRSYSVRVALLGVIVAIVIFNIEAIVGAILPYLGNVGVYLNAKEISDVYDMGNYLQGLEFPLFFIFVGMQARSSFPAIVVGAAFVVTRMLAELPTVITMRFFELFCLLFLFSSLHNLKARLIPTLMFGSILLGRLYLHYSSVVD